ncbi:MAG: C40 family peptidase [Abitibacteriaceae bacterium]|nr:C40 family peptidase [Abditibacteriaceae bacterium]
MPFTRQRHHGMHETPASKRHGSKSHQTSPSHPIQPLHQPHKIHSSQAIRHRTARHSSRRTGTLAVSLAAAAFSHTAVSLAKKPNQKNTPAQTTAEKPTGVWGWTSGAQTYLRSRPGALTAPVAKVSKHTKLFVWGKFDGWYRVETPDHVFGWVYHSYINSPDTPKIQELSHCKAKEASDRTANQTMYGPANLLKRQYALYKAPGAAHSLEKAGVVVAAAPAPKKTKSMVKVASKSAAKTAPRVAAVPGTTKAQGKDTAQVSTVSTVPERYARRDIGRGRAGTIGGPEMPLTDMNEVGTVRFSPSLAPSHRQETVNGATTSNNADDKTPASRATPDSTPAPNSDAAPTTQPTNAAVAATPSGATSAKGKQTTKPATAKALATTRRVSHPKVQKVNQPRVPKTVAKVIKAAAPAKVAQPQPVKPQMAKAAPIHAPVTVAQAQPKPAAKPLSPRQQRRLAAAQWRQHVKDVRRERLRAQMGNPATMVPPAVSPQLAPISPAELMRARDAFMAEHSKNQPTSNNQPTQSATPPTLPSGTNAIVSPSSLDTTHKVSPLVPVAPAKVQPIHQTRSNAQPSRGGSPRDYLKASMNHARLGQTLVDGAMTYRGYPYIRGAQSPGRGFDCSGLLYYLLRQRGYNPPRTASGYAHYGQAVDKAQLQPGDVLLFANTYKRGISHVGIYMGNGRFIHAANSGRGVTTDLLSEPYYAGKYYGARRVK